MVKNLKPPDVKYNMGKKKSSLVLKFLLLIIISSIVTIRFAKANPVVYYPSLIPEYPIARLIIISIFFVIGVLIEYGYFKSKFSNKCLTFENKPLFMTLFKVNVVTYPLTQVLAYIVYIFLISFFWPLILLIETFVILSEWKLLNLEFNKMLEEKIYSKNVLKYAIIANLYSFLIGLIGFIPWLAVMIYSVFL